MSNPYLTAPLGRTYARTALPIICVMGMNGALAVADAVFLGHFVGPEALAAVTLMFPIYMLIVALATLVSNGMSSLLARALGADDMHAARAIFAGAHGLAVTLGAALIVVFAIWGASFAHLVAAGAEDLARLGLIYLRIMVAFAPLMFVLSVQSDSLRSEGRVGFMAAMSLLVSLSNIAFNYVLIARFEMGVAGSAYGTVLAQALALGLIVRARLRRKTPLDVPSRRAPFTARWGRILALGAPQSLNFIGFALGSAAILAALQWVKSPSYDQTVTAYGIITRVITFAFLPLLGLSHAMQSITGSNFGAGLWQRSNDSLRFALWTALMYCALVQGVVTGFAPAIGAAFVDDAAVVAEVARILPIMSLLFILSGPLMVVAMHFQAVGDATRAGLLGLSKPYLFAIPLTFVLAAWMGEIGIWLAAPVAELCLLALTIWVLSRTARRTSLRWGLFEPNLRRLA